MKFYLAARYSRHPEMLAYAGQIQERGDEVTSRWINGDHDYRGEQSPTLDRLRFATEDWDDLKDADCLVSFTEEPGKAGGRNRGGRHVEFGAGLAFGKHMVVIGYRENVFHELPGVEFHQTFEEFLRCHYREANNAKRRAEEALQHVPF